jgi:hypothetical protein
VSPTVVHRGNEREFLLALENTLASPHFKNKEVLLLGDFNLDLLKVDSNQNVSNLLDMLMNFHMIPMITLPTRISSTSATLIDHVYHSFNSRKNFAGTLLNEITDHFINIVLLEKTKAQKHLPEFLTFRSFNESNIKNYNDHLESLRTDCNATILIKQMLMNKYKYKICM